MAYIAFCTMHSTIMPCRGSLVTWRYFVFVYCSQLFSIFVFCHAQNSNSNSSITTKWFQVLCIQLEVAEVDIVMYDFFEGQLEYNWEMMMMEKCLAFFRTFVVCFWWTRVSWQDLDYSNIPLHCFILLSLTFEMLAWCRSTTHCSQSTISSREILIWMWIRLFE